MQMKGIRRDDIRQDFAAEKQHGLGFTGRGKEAINPGSRRNPFRKEEDMDEGEKFREDALRVKQMVK